MTRNGKKLLGIAALTVVLVSVPLVEAIAQQEKTLVYELGSSMMDLVVEQRAYEGASPVELEGIREGMERQREESPLRVTLHPDGTCVFEADGQKQESAYVTMGLKLKIENEETGEFVEIGYFSKDSKKLTVMDQYILDLVE